MALAFLLRPRAPLLRRLSSTSAFRRHFTSLPSSVVELDISHPTYMVWGSNTGVGKTLVSTGLAFSVLSSKPSTFLYLKPVQTGFPTDSDSRFVHRKVSRLFRDSALGLVSSDRALSASVPATRELVGEDAGVEEGTGYLCLPEDKFMKGKGESKLVCESLYCWKEPVSPHVAVEREGALVEDESLLDSMQRCLDLGLDDWNRRKENLWRVVETAGGVASPGPSGTLQCDLYRPLRIPAILVGDGRLGGISATISSYETLKLRGYDIIAVILEDRGLSNEISLLSYLRNRVHVLVMPPIPCDPSNDLIKWFGKSSRTFDLLRDLMCAAHSKRIRGLHDMAARAGDILWWPFTQHQLVPKDAVTVIDSRCGESFAVHKVHGNRELLTPQFDACASWWTQGPDATLQIELAKDMGYTTARYGHVMFPENVYEPAVHLADMLLKSVGKGWASRVFFSDNGSTAIEIALKMAFRKFLYDHGIISDAYNESLGTMDLKVLALSGSYHGDTLGAMEAQAPSSYTSFLQQPWYSGRGFFLEPPSVFFQNGKWHLSLPENLALGKWINKNTGFSMLEDIFHRSRDSSDLAQKYSDYIVKNISQYLKLNQNSRIGALIIEPVIQAAGGMHMIDPLFQRILVKEFKISKIPVIFDEVFTGFWRLGRESASELLGCLPDIACYAKLMTGGVIPMAATLATEAVFDTFKGNSKVMSLLHGHSYTAHAMGCTAAAKAISWYKDPLMNPNISSTGEKLKELWDTDLLLQISSHSAVQRVVALGTLCAIELKAEGVDAGYASLYAASLMEKLRKDGIYMRPLGNVVYLMCGPCTPSRLCNEHLMKVYQEIKEFSKHIAAKEQHA